jgi:hypothetical protein
MAALSFKFLANDKGLRDGIKRSQKGLSGFEKTTKKVGAGISKTLGSFGIALGASALISGLTNATKAAAEDLKQQKLLAGQLKRTTQASDAQIKGAERYVQTLSEQTGILDDDLRPALSNAVRGSGSLAKGQKLLRIALDGSVASGKPLDTVLNALIKANNGNTQSLYRLAPELKATKGSIDDYAKSVKGAAEAGADPFAKFNVAVENLTETFGALLLPYVEQFVTFLTEQAIPAVSDFIDDINNPNTDTGKVFIVIKETLVGKNGKGGVYGAVLEVIDAFAMFFSSLSSNGNSLDGLVKAIQVLGLSLEFAVRQAMNLATLFSNPLAIIDINKQSLDYAARVAEIWNRPSLFGTSYNGQASPGQTGLSARVTEGITGQSNYTININKANMTPNEIIAAIKKYERENGKKP